MLQYSVDVEIVMTAITPLPAAPFYDQAVASGIAVGSVVPTVCL